MIELRLIFFRHIQAQEGSRSEFQNPETIT